MTRRSSSAWRRFCCRRLGTGGLGAGMHAATVWTAVSSASAGWRPVSTRRRRAAARSGGEAVAPGAKSRGRSSSRSCSNSLPMPGSLEAPPVRPSRTGVHPYTQTRLPQPPTFCRQQMPLQLASTPPRATSAVPRPRWAHAASPKPPPGVRSCRRPCGLHLRGGLQ